MSGLGVADLLSPVGIDGFLRDHAFTRPVVVPGPADKFRSLFTWDSLNRLLSYSRHDAVRVHLNRVGTPADEMPFTHLVANVRGERIPHIDTGLLYRHLRDGATLVVDAVQDVDPAIADLSEQLAAVLRAERATTVAFASFGHTPGFAAHWDNRDVYALQVEGEKHWRIHEPSRAAPLTRGDQFVPGSGEPGDLVWEGLVRAGDLVYVPRGWWHEVASVDAPSLHLNVGFAPVTALDLVARLVTELEREDLMRLDLPQFHADRLAQHERAVKDLIVGRLNELSFGGLLAGIGADARRQTHVSLPHGVHADRPTLAADLLVRLSSATAAVVTTGGACMLVSEGAAVELDAASAPMLERLACGGATTVGELTSAAPGLTTDQCRSVLARLIGVGLVHTVLP